MKITVNENSKVQETHIEITCNKITPDIEKIVATLRMMEKQLTGKLDGQTYLISATDVIYIEAVERKSFLYTNDSCYETDFKLYELEEQLMSGNFFRISKSMLVNLQKVQSIKADFNRRLLVTMCNGEQVIVSRQYADNFRKMLGVR